MSTRFLSSVSSVMTLLCVLVVIGAAKADDVGALQQVASQSTDRVIDHTYAPLSEDDVARYRRIMDDQDRGNWRQADAEIQKLGSDLLMGHVWAQRYLHPTKYRSRYKELKGWMASYGDHPDAKRLYDLALTRRPANWTAPKRPQSNARAWSGYEKTATPRPRPAKKSLNAQQRKRARTLMHMVRSYLRKGATKSAKQVILSKEAATLLSAYEMDEMRSRLGYAYLMDGHTEWALEWTGKAAKRSGRYIPETHWIAGLAAWRLNRFDEAAAYFEALADFPGASPWLVSSGAFWAARTHLVNRRPGDVTQWLEKAAGHPRTFYGLLAIRLLGRDGEQDFSMPDVPADMAQFLASTPHGRRALALLQIGEERRAERELQNLAAVSDRETAEAVMAFAAGIGLETLSIRLGRMLFPAGDGPAAVVYPLPEWEPEDGFRVDRALIYALVRQESGFNPNAKSWAGARGLMQLMPRTASFVAGGGSFHRSKASKQTLFEPTLNLSLGQRYIEMLLSDRKISGDLFLMAAAWNGGPGNLNKWRRRVDDGNDPLFFIETLPSRETRIFIERVLANFWMYRHRLGQPSPSLDALAAGQWPVYTGLDDTKVQVAEN